jgi:hypothetical protein
VLHEAGNHAGRFVDAYERLKLEMDRLRKHEDELEFFIRELQSRRIVVGDWQHIHDLEILGRAIRLSPLKLFKLRNAIFVWLARA